MKRIKAVIALILIAILAIGITGCGEKKVTDNKKVIRFGTVDTKAAIDMQKVTYSQVVNISDSMYEALITTGNDLKLKPVLLKEMPTKSADGLTYSFELKPGVKFHNGEILKSSDVKFSFERNLSEGVMSNLIDMIVGADKVVNKEATTLEGFKIIDDTKFEITLQYVFEPFTATIATPYMVIFPEKACKEAGKNWGVTTMIGTGPFKLKEYIQGNHIVVVKNTDYHGDVPKVDEVEYRFMADSNTMMMEYEKGNIDVMLLDATLYNTYANDPKIKDEMHKFTPLGLVYLNPNNKDKDLKNPKVKEALSYAIDREKISKDLLHGTVTPATTFIPNGLDGYNKDAKPYEYNVEKAKQLLAEAGYANGLDLEATVMAKYPAFVQVLTVIQAQLKLAGVNLKITQVDGATWTDMKKNHKIQLCLGNWYIDYVDPDGMIYQTLHSKITKNSSNQYSNPEFDKLLDEARTISDKDKRIELYKKADEIATRIDYADIPLYNENMFYLCKPYLKDFEVTAAYRLRFAGSDIDLSMKNTK